MKYKFKLKFLDYNPEFEKLTDSLENFELEDSVRVREIFDDVMDRIYEQHFQNPPSDEDHVPVLRLIKILHEELVPGTKDWEYFIILLLSDRIQRKLSDLCAEDMEIQQLLLGQRGKA